MALQVRRYVYLPRGRLTHLERDSDTTICGEDTSRARVVHTVGLPRYPWCKICGKEDHAKRRPIGLEAEHG